MRRLVVDGGGVGLAVAVDGRRAGRHLEEDDGGGVPLGGAVVPVAQPDEERVEVGRGAGVDRRGGCPGEGEVEEDEVLGAVAAVLADAEVGGLDVAVVDPGLVEGDEAVEEVVAVALEEVEGEPGAGAEDLGEGLGAGVLEEERLASADDEGALDDLDDAGAVQGAEDLGLGGQARRGILIECDLEDALGVGAGGGEVGDEEAGGRRALPESSLELEPAVEGGAGVGLERVLLAALAGRLAFGLRRGVRGRRPCRRGGGTASGWWSAGRGCAARRRPGAARWRGRGPAGRAGGCAGRCAVGAGGLAGQEVEGERAEAEDVEADAVGVRLPDSLGGAEALGEPALGVLVVGACVLAAVPVAPNRAVTPGPAVRVIPERSTTPAACQSPSRTLTSSEVPGTRRTHTAFGERPRWTILLPCAYWRVSPICRIIDSWVLERDAVVLAGQPQVEPLPRLVVRVDEADAELGLDDVAGPQEAVVLEPRHQPVLVLGDLAGVGADLVGGARGGDGEADAGAVLLDDVVVGQPVLPAVAGVDGLVLDDPRAGLALAALDQADALHQLGEDAAPGCGRWGCCRAPRG